MSKIEYKELLAFHPGYYVKDYIDDQQISQDELAKRLQVSSKYVSDLVNGRISLTDDMVLRLSTVFGTSTKLWLNLNQKYIEKKLEIDKKMKIDGECEIAKQIDYSFWKNLGLVKDTKVLTEKVEELQKFFQVASLSVLNQRDFLVQYRTSISNISDVNVINANAWVQTAINIGKSRIVNSYNRKKLLEAIPVIREMTIENPDVFMPKLVQLLADCGVVLVLLPNLKNCGINGAVKWINKEKVVLALNDRRKFADVFWFALFHELGHVLQQRIKVLLVSENNKEALDMNDVMYKLECEADEFSRNTLIPKKDYDEFIASGEGFTIDTILSFARKIRVLPGIVVGRLQKDNYVNYNSSLNSLRNKYVIE